MDWSCLNEKEVNALNAEFNSYLRKENIEKYFRKRRGINYSPLFGVNKLPAGLARSTRVKVDAPTNMIDAMEASAKANADAAAAVDAPVDKEDSGDESSEEPVVKADVDDIFDFLNDEAGKESDKEEEAGEDTIDENIAGNDTIEEPVGNELVKVKPITKNSGLYKQGKEWFYFNKKSDGTVGPLKRDIEYKGVLTQNIAEFIQGERSVNDLNEKDMIQLKYYKDLVDFAGPLNISQKEAVNRRIADERRASSEGRGLKRKAAKRKGAANIRKNVLHEGRGCGKSKQKTLGILRAQKAAGNNSKLLQKKIKMLEGK